MSRIQCSKCGLEADGLDAPPLPGPVGRQVADGSCRDCWKLWLEEQVKLINEHSLSPANPEHYAFLLKEMTSFLFSDSRESGAPRDR